MTTATPSPALAAGVRLGALGYDALDWSARLARAAEQRAVRRDPVTNEVAPLVLIAVIAVAGALALVAVIGALAAWVYYCQAYFGRSYWPAVSWPGQSGGLFYLACKRV